jgi:hypothetical protein
MNKDETGAVSTENALKMAIEGYEQCLDDLQGWPAYASEYFQDKWDLEGEVKDHRDKIQSCKEALEQPEDYLYVYKGSEMWLKDSLDIPSAGFLIGKIRLEK